MLTRSATYNSIFAGQHSVEWKITVNGTDYGMDKIAADVGGGHALPHIHRQAFTGNGPSIGGCVSSTFECSIFEASANVPRMATVVPKYRLLTEMQTSEWITLGTFYIDTRTVDEINGILDLSCFDAMLKADGVGGNCYADVTGFDEWPQDMDDVVDEICSIIGVTLDSRTTIHSGTGYQVEYPNDLTMREVLGYIAVHHAGNFTITPDNKLRLVPLTGNSDTLNLGTNTAQLHTAPAFSVWSKVTVYWADEEAYEAGSATGRELVCESPWATQETANGILSAISGTTYLPYNGTGSFIDLALEVGDKVTVGYTGQEITSPAFTIDVTAEVLEVAGIAAEGEQEIDHEYPYADYVDRSLRRKVGLNTPYYGVTISRQKGLEIKRTDGASEALFNSDVFTMRALIDGVMKDRIYFDPIKGDYVFDGALGADAVFTDSLYAEQGDIAELTVDRLSTSRRIRKYILQDYSDDNFIRIQDQYIHWITGTIISSTGLLTEDEDLLLTESGIPITEEVGSAATEQARNRFGQGLYWQREPVGHTSDGYPLDVNGVQVYATTNVTDWPVAVYKYTELVKSQYAFEQQGQNYIPQIILGAGDENGNSKGYIYKDETRLLMRYISSLGKNVDISWNDDGFVDAMHRRLNSLVLDVNGHDIVYTLEGSTSLYRLTYSISGDTITFTWPDGYTCDINIPDDGGGGGGGGGGGPSPSSSTPAMDGPASPGVSTTYARGDHVHPTDTSRVPTHRTVNGKPLSSNVTLSASDVGAIPSSEKGAAGGVAELDADGMIPSTQLDLSGKQDEITASGILKGDGSGNISAAVAGTDYGTYSKPSGGIPAADIASGVIPAASNVAPPMDGTASPGSTGQWADGGHVHPTDTSRMPKNGLGKNLLHNWYFAGSLFPIDQRGGAPYSGNAGYSIDRWYRRNTSNAGNPTLAIGADGIVLTTDGLAAEGLNQAVESKDLLAGKTVTLSALIESNTYAASCYLGLWEANSIGANTTTLSYAEISGQTGLLTVTGTLPSTFTGSLLICGIYCGTAAGSIKIKAVKLELGTEQTLAHQENGAWVLNEVPDYEPEYQKCSYYFQRIKYASGTGVASGFARMYRTGRWNVIVPLISPIRQTAPTVTITNVGVLMIDGDNTYSNYIFTTLPINIGLLGNALRFNITEGTAYTGGYRNAMEFLVFPDSTSCIDISCDL